MKEGQNEIMQNKITYCIPAELADSDIGLGERSQNGHTAIPTQS